MLPEAVAVFANMVEVQLAEPSRLSTSVLRPGHCLTCLAFTSISAKLSSSTAYTGRHRPCAGEASPPLQGQRAG